MGVTGLWSLIEDSGTKVNIETLRGKVLAIGEFKSFFRLFLFIFQFFRLVNLDQPVNQRLQR